MKPIKLFLGCGPLPIHPQHLQFIDSSWILADKYVKAPGIQNIDAVDLSTFTDGSVDEIYHSHLWEHLSFKESKQALSEWYRVLKEQGRLTVNVPDIRWAAKEIISEEKTSKVFNTEEKLMEVIYGNQDHVGEFHKCGFTKDILYSKLKEIGFININIKEVYEAHQMGCLIATAIKP